MKKIILLMASVISMNSIAQKESLSYHEVKQLSDLSSKKQTDQQTLRELGEAHIFNAAYQEAFPFYKRMFQNQTDLIPEDYYNFAQVLRTKGDYGQAEKYMQQYANKLGQYYTPLDEKEYAHKIDVQSDRCDIQKLKTNTNFSEIPVWFSENKLYYLTNQSGGVDLPETSSNSFNLWKANVSDIGTINNPEKMLDLNNRLNEGGFTISKNAEWGFFTQNNAKSGQLEIIRAIQVDGKWVVEDPVHFCSEEYSVMHPVMGPDNKDLFFVSDMPGGYGKTDIYVAKILSDGSLGQPKNLGNTVNSQGREAFPFLHTSGEMYFSSDGHYSLGGLDIFRTKYDPSNLTYEAPVNVGRPINSNFDDFAYIFIDEKRGYFASNRQGGKGNDDIYFFKENAPLRITEDLVFKEIKLNGRKKFSSTDKIDQGSYFLLPKDKSKIIDPERGLRKINLTSNGKYALGTDFESGQYFAIPESALTEDAPLRYVNVDFNDDGTFQSESYVEEGTYYLLPKDELKNQKNRLIEPAFVAGNGTYNSSKELTNGIYALVPKKASEIANTTGIFGFSTLKNKRISQSNRVLKPGKYVVVSKQKLKELKYTEASKKITIQPNNRYESDRYIDKGEYYLIPDEENGQNFEDTKNNFQVVFNDDGTYTADENVPEGKYHLIPKEIRHLEKFISDEIVVKKNGEYAAGKNNLSGEYLLLPFQGELIGNAELISAANRLNNDGTYDVNQEITPGSYFLLGAENSSENPAIQKHKIRVNDDGTYSGTTPIDKGAYYLVPADENDATFKDDNVVIELLDDGTYKGTEISSGDYYVIPKYTELIEDANLGMNMVKINPDGTFYSNKRNTAGNFYLIPREDILNDELAEIGEVKDIKNIYFDVNKSDITNASTQELERLSDYLITYPTAKVQMYGHADPRGSEEYNMALSERRAKEAVKYLMKKGITKDRVFWQAKGEMSPISNCPSGDCEDQFAKDRRVEFVLFE